ncbi:MAG: SGNH/GDSL hydrolase family protein [Bacteriovoracaceae bacterium]
MKRFFQYSLLTVGPVVLVFCLLEATLCLLKLGTPSEGEWNSRSAGGPMVMKDPYTGLRPKPGFTSNEVTLNSFGARDNELNTSAQKFVLCLGDSTTFGWKISNVQAVYCNLLQDQLNAQKNLVWETVNAGVPSYTLFQGMQLFYHYLESLAEWNYVVLTFGWNENPDFDLDLAFTLKQPPVENHWLRKTYELARRLRTFNVLESQFSESLRPNIDPFMKSQDEYVRLYRDFLRALKKRNIKPIILPVLYSAKFTRVGLIKRMKIFNRAIGIVAKEEQVLFAGELEEKFKSDPDIGWFDPYHYNEVGHRYIANYLMKKMTKGK